jgi:hypothetical protein
MVISHKTIALLLNWRRHGHFRGIVERKDIHQKKLVVPYVTVYDSTAKV